MELYLDTANLKDIQELNQVLQLDGVTTNPTILTKETGHYLDTIKQISSILSDKQKLFMQVISSDVIGMVEEAKNICQLRRENMYVKIPATKAGLEAIKIAHNEGCKILATAIYSSTQAFLAAKNGADYLAPYVNRMENFMDGISEVIDLQEMLANYGFNSKVIAASFKNVNQVKQLMVAGIDAVTVPADVLRNMYSSPYTDIAVDEFNSNWKNRFNEEKLSF